MNVVLRPAFEFGKEFAGVPRRLAVLDVPSK
jgi:hypothetical protein